MTPSFEMLGKRKRSAMVVRRLEVSEESTNSGTDGESLRKYFESKFEPLEKLSQTTPALSLLEDREGDSDLGAVSDSEWEGLSHDTESIPAVEVIEHATPLQELTSNTRSAEFKSFMNSKVPANAVISKTLSPEKTEDDGAETLNLKHDIDLQRLLKESHLLEKAKPLKVSDGQRHRATDLRLQSLGSQSSLFEQPNMPLSHRRGIKAKAASRKQLRRQDAKENGIILEKIARPSKSVVKKRDRGVDGPLVGKFQHGTLKLNHQDIASIQGVPRDSGRRGKR